ncbi:MAG: hypothetical protein ABI345_02425, partial [Jatrophihabitans sp.]
TSIYFLIDKTKGGAVVSVLVLLASIVALVLSFAPSAWEHIGRAAPRAVTRAYNWRPGGSGPESTAGDQSSLPRSSDPTRVESTTLRRRSSSSH